jgi:hypothetical protein
VNNIKKMKRLILSIVVASATLATMGSCTVVRPVTISDAEMGDLRGESHSIVVFGGVYLNPKYGIKDAAYNGNITSAIATVDEKTTSFLLFSRKTMIVTAKK